jgi:DNA-binding CsgD family transcriptional regulator
MVQGRPETSARPDPLVEELRRFALGALRASSSVFYWIDQCAEMADVQLTGTCRASFQRYADQMKAFDPLNVPRLVSSGRRVSPLQKDHVLAPPTDYERYRGYMSEIGIVDVLDLVFWDGDIPFAGLGIIKNPGDPPFCEGSFAFAGSMQPYIEFNLAAHPRLRQQRLAWRLTATYGLTRREIEIAELVCQGLTNQDIREELGIGVGTVKTHLIRIFQKMGTKNRASLISRVGHAGSNEWSLAGR